MYNSEWGVPTPQMFLKEYIKTFTLQSSKALISSILPPSPCPFPSPVLKKAFSVKDHTVTMCVCVFVYSNHSECESEERFGIFCHLCGVIGLCYSQIWEQAGHIQMIHLKHYDSTFNSHSFVPKHSGTCSLLWC